MKRCNLLIFCFLSLVFLALFLPRLPGFAQSAVPEGFTGITDRAGLEAVTAAPDGKYILLNDIDLSAEPWVPLCTEDAPFTGVFDGNGFTVYAFSATAEAGAVGLFSHLDGATVKNLTVKGAVTGPVAGILVGKIARSTLENCTFSGTVNTGFFGGGAAGQISESGTTFTDCTSDVDVSGTGAESSEVFVGGFAGAVYGADQVFSGCEFQGSLTLSGSDVVAGGIVGEAGGAVTFADCGNEGTLALSYTDFAAVGGIAGRAGKGETSFLRCSFRADYGSTVCSGVLQMGGICGEISAAAPVTVTECVSLGSLAGAGHPDFAENEGVFSCIACQTLLTEGSLSAYVGGIAGTVRAAEGAVTLSRCRSAATLSGSGSAVVLGGIAGVNRSDGQPAVISDCLADGRVYCDSPIRGNLFSFAGGIAGQNTGTGRAELLHCLSFAEVVATHSLLEGAVVGLNAPDFGSEGVAAVTECYFPVGQRDFYATPLEGSLLSDPVAYVGLDFELVWKTDPISGLPLLREEGGVASCPVGDLDGNGKVTRYDGLLLTRYLTGKTTLTAAQLARADFNGDGNIDALDGALLLRSVS